ncbi:inositol monophosphatase family protein [Faucicola mancuniensis]|uniref:inositol monophosphatase family protein n=1 Tax=Faucicola mancuniensis TaxID=1309795 RepID=UPI0028EEB8F4|nr:inositol monophosphatase family protein [uncultured Moraxella sp.]
MEPMVVMAARAAQKVGNEILNAHLNRHKIELNIESKGLDGLVTQIDRYSEELLIATLKESYPNHSFLGEEFGLQEGKGNDADWCWVIDPLDGTHNFVHGLPHFCVSIGVQKNGVTEHAVIYDPVRDETFSASRGKGARLNQRRINVSEHKTIDGGFFTTGHPLERNRADGVHSYAKEHFATLQAICEKGGQVRRLGSAALDLAYVACGRVDGYFEMSIKPWDICAGELIVSEARGTVVDASGAHNAMDTGSIFACNVKLLKPLIQTVVPLWGDAVKS